MIAAMFVILLAIFGYFGYIEGMKKLDKYLAARLAQMKESEDTAMKTLMEQVSKTVTNPGQKMSDDEFTATLDRLFVPWGRTKGIIR